MLIAVEDLQALPCWKCQHPQADQVRHLIGQGGGLEESQLTLNGLPVNCCRVRVLGSMTTFR